jgi:hypothetical protein
MNNNKNLKPIHLGVIQEFPFVDATFDDITYIQILSKLGNKTNEVIRFINNVLEDKLVEYIDKRFNDIMLDSMYESETETLVLYLTHESEG